MLPLYNISFPIMIVAEYSISCYFLIYTSPESFSRTIVGFTLIAVCLAEFIVLSRIDAHFLISGLIAILTLIKDLHFISILAIIQPDIRRTKFNTFTSSTLHEHSHLSFALWTLTSTRGIGTQWQIRNIPQGNNHFITNGKNPTARFLIRQLSIIVWQYIALDIIYFGLLLDVQSTASHLYAFGTEIISTKTTVSHLAVRAILSAMFLIGTILLLDIVHRGLSVAAVATGVTEWVDWPPIFGDWKDATSVRKFWGRFWHQLIRFPLKTIAQKLKESILGLSPFEGYTNLAMAFIISGWIHFAAIPRHVASDETYGVIFAFAATTISIFTEDHFPLSEIFPGWLRNVLGYLWVLLWLYVTMPWLVFAICRVPVTSSWFFPYSFVENHGKLYPTLFLAAGGILLYKVMHVRI